MQLEEGQANGSMKNQLIWPYYTLKDPTTKIIFLGGCFSVFTLVCARAIYNEFVMPNAQCNANYSMKSPSRSGSKWQWPLDLFWDIAMFPLEYHTVPPTQYSAASLIDETIIPPNYKN